MKNQKKSQKKSDLREDRMTLSPEEKPLRVFEEDADHLSGNVIVFRIDGEEVVLGFGNRRFNNPHEVDIHSFIHLSIPHFIRLYFMLVNNMKTMKEKGIIDIETIDIDQKVLSLKLEE